ncbi:uncharacterized protein LOC132709675 [Pantherophis guttatus]|uniref:Uncharacterized protein LOC132709675 n=1 Tax=Pantherophis guttatus TaxID=94885 RepID=A0ABM3YV45_PANGU|nr:uncharacterized protein LOC132709675 [Pantherophis guttatus]
MVASRVLAASWHLLLWPGKTVLTASREEKGCQSRPAAKKLGELPAGVAASQARSERPPRLFCCPAEPPRRASALAGKGVPLRSARNQKIRPPTALRLHLRLLPLCRLRQGSRRRSGLARRCWPEGPQVGRPVRGRAGSRVLLAGRRGPPPGAGGCDEEPPGTDGLRPRVMGANLRGTRPSTFSFRGLPGRPPREGEHDCSLEAG